MPNTPPSSRIALFAPEAMPSSVRRTELSTTFATGAKNSDMPTPETTNAGTRSRYGTVGDATSASQPSPMACRSRTARSPSTGSGAAAVPFQHAVPLRRATKPAPVITAVGAGPDIARVLAANVRLSDLRGLSLRPESTTSRPLAAHLPYSLQFGRVEVH